MDKEFYHAEFKRVAKLVFDHATGYDAELMLSANSNALTRFANNIIHQNISTSDSNVSIRLQKAKKTGTVTVGLFSGDNVIIEAVKKAAEIVEQSAEAPGLMPMLGEQKYEKTDGYCHHTAELPPDLKADIVAKIVRECEKENFSAAGIVQNGAYAIGIANTNGLRAFDVGSDFEFSLTVEGKDGTGWAESRSWAVFDVDVDADIVEVIEIARKNKNPRNIEPGAYTVVLPPAAVAELVLFLNIYGFNARSHLEKNSFLMGKLGQKVFSDKLTIVDDAYDKRWSGLPFDFEGVPRKRVELVENGVLVGLVYDRFTAEKMNAEPTGHGLRQPNQWGAFASNLIVAPGTVLMKDMIKSVKRGLLVTHFHYTNVSELAKLTITGMTRDGLFLVENGEIAYPVKNLRFTQSVPEALNNIAVVGKEQKLVSGFFFGGAIVPGMVIDGFNFSSGTEFGG